MSLNIKGLFPKPKNPEKDPSFLRVKIPTKKQWKKFFSVLSKKEKVSFSSFLLLLIASGLFLVLGYYYKNTQPAPAPGGIYTEGIIGQPRIINPLYLSTQDIDRDIVEIVFGGLMKYDENGQIIKDLTQDYSIKEQGKVFEITLKENLVWHDNEPLTADDVIFTVNLIQNPEYQSPLRVKWAGITAEKITNRTVSFKLPKEYAGFTETLTVKILPKHIFENVSPQNLPLSLVSEEYLIGSGPFKLKKIDHDQTSSITKITLEKNKDYYGQIPFLKEIVFAFFKDEKALKKSIALDEVNGFSISDPSQYKDITKGFKVYSIAAPRYFAVFFNAKNLGVFKNQELKEALALSTNKEALVQNVFTGKAQAVNSPILPSFFDFQQPNTTDQLNIVKAQQLIQQAIASSKEATVFTQNLTYGSSGEEVKMLQTCLAKFSDIYPNGEINGNFGPKTKEAVIKFQEKYTDEVLAPSNITKGTGDVKTATRKKLNEICFEPESTSTENIPITLTTCDKFPLPAIAQELKKQWDEVGFDVTIETVSLADLQNNVLTKNSFNILLFGEALGAIPDPFPFWHSSQKDYPGLNIANYTSKAADSYLEKAREAQTAQERQAYLEYFQDTLIQDMPAIFLVMPDYVYVLSDIIKGFEVAKITEPAKRFSNIEQWYIKTKRVWK
ncbi:MAG: ABC transporter substrate-binding protein [Candidatus Pacebacteria bacterium]|nr:ABC transporter substrate-binding protein [Candidatus Paceibacterota bacterium]